MTSTYIETGGHVRVYDAAVRTHHEFPLGTYRVHFTSKEGFSLIKIDDLTVGTERVYGGRDRKVDKIDLSAKADAVLDNIGDVLATVDNQVSVEGHADHRVSAAPFPTNWELSGGRATQVARFLVEHEGLGGPRVKATAFSDTRPIVPGDSPQALASNRRVDIVVESNEEEQVRALIDPFSVTLLV